MVVPQTWRRNERSGLRVPVCSFADPDSGLSRTFASFALSRLPGHPVVANSQELARASSHIRWRRFVLIRSSFVMSHRIAETMGPDYLVVVSLRSERP